LKPFAELENYAEVLRGALTPAAVLDKAHGFYCMGLFFKQRVAERTERLKEVQRLEGGVSARGTRALELSSGMKTTTGSQVGSITLGSVNHHLPCLCYQPLTCNSSFYYV
jgi:hypothetical protein